MYTYDHILGSGASAPRWGDTCPTPPGATTDGCVVSSRISRFGVSGTTITGPEQVLVEDWCQQSPSHSAGTLLFGPDGALYASGGDGASFNVADYGQLGGTTNPLVTDKNPCGDPPDDAMAPPTAEGGALRTQDLRTNPDGVGDPVGLDGSIVRIDPVSGLGKAGNPYAASPDLNARRIIAEGFRNPFRMTFRPGTDELWVGDVGWNLREEMNRIPDATDSTAENFGWPCYEGTGHTAAYDSPNLPDRKLIHHRHRLLPELRRVLPDELSRRGLLRRSQPQLHLVHAQGDQRRPGSLAGGGLHRGGCGAG
jgi:glucose/arabinose dehydrogenase